MVLKYCLLLNETNGKHTRP